MTTTPEPPYMAVIFTNQRAEFGHDEADAAYNAAAARMEELAETIPGYLGIESCRSVDGMGITVSYWADEQAIETWRRHPEHLDVQAQGRNEWYKWYELRVARVERARRFPSHEEATPVSESIFDRIRDSCAAVAEISTHVTVVDERIAAFAAELVIDSADRQVDAVHRRTGSDEATTAFVLALDAINFGSGYFPVLRKRPGLSGYYTIANSVRDLVADTGALTADRLAAWTVEDTAATFGQALDGGRVGELMELFTEAWHDLAAFVNRVGDGSFVATIAAANGSAARLVEMLDEVPFFHDVHRHPKTGEVLFYKRAQITAQDLSIVFDGEGPGRFEDRTELTMFADNLVPHVLRVEGVLRFSDDLVARIDAVDNIALGSPEEVEIRACGLNAVERLRSELAGQGTIVSSGDLDNVLWNLGGDPQYKAVPRHRTRCVFY